MKFQFYYEKMINSQEFETFKKEHPKAFPCSGFFVMDLEKNDHKFHLDFYNPEIEKMFSFQLTQQVSFNELENFDKINIPKEIQLNYDFDLKDYEEIIRKEIAERMINGKIQRILFSLQKKENKNYFLITCFLSNMALLKIVINIDENKIEEFEKKSFFDMIRVVKGNKKEDK